MSIVERKRKGGRTVAIILLALVCFMVYNHLRTRIVELPPAYSQTLKERVDSDIWAKSLLEARKTSGGYMVELSSKYEDGRVVKYVYEVTEDLHVVEKGMVIGYANKDPVNLLLALILGALLLGYALVVWGKKWFDKRCPQCRHATTVETIHLYSGGHDSQGVLLPPIMLTTQSCPHCAYLKHRVHVPTVRSDAMVLNPSGRWTETTEKLDQLIDKHKEQARLTEADWKAMLDRFKQEYEQRI